MNHFNLKSWPKYFEQVEQGYKRFEIRKLDRLDVFSKGDTITLREFDPEKNAYTGREISGIITYVLIVNDVPGIEMPLSAQNLFCGFGFSVRGDYPVKITGEAAQRWKEFFTACCANIMSDSELTAEAAVRMGAKCADLMEKEFESRFDGKVYRP